MLSANFKPKRIAAASRGFLAIARLSCCHFLSNRSVFLHEISHILLAAYLIMTKLLNFLGNHVVISDIHEMFAEGKTHHLL